MTLKRARLPYISHRVPGVRPNQAERMFVPAVVFEKVGTALSADWMRGVNCVHAAVATT